MLRDMTDWTRVPGLFREHEVGTVVCGDATKDWRVGGMRNEDGTPTDPPLYQVFWTWADDTPIRHARSRTKSVRAAAYDFARDMDAIAEKHHGGDLDFDSGEEP